MDICITKIDDELYLAKMYGRGLTPLRFPLTGRGRTAEEAVGNLITRNSSELGIFIVRQSTTTNSPFESRRLSRECIPMEVL